MPLTKKQEEGLQIVKNRYYNNEPYTIIAGYAGTGKSYLVNAIVENLGFAEEEVAYACYTGKAALVLQNQGKNAITLHKLLYNSYRDDNGNFIHVPKKELIPKPQLVIIDEISMCPKRFWNLLLSHKVHVIGLGDPFQLPPIGDTLDLLSKPHVFLTEIVRQALDNDIIKYSMELREGKELAPGIDGTHLKTYDKSFLSTGMLKWADQILCGKNNTRKFLNSEMRKLLNKKSIIDEHEKLICLKNYWETLSSDVNPLVNGCIGELVDVLYNPLGNHITGNFVVDNYGTFDKLKLDYNVLTNGAPTIRRNRQGKVLPNYLIEMDYGYAITVHKAQGSQFNKVLVYDEHLWQEENHNRWLYTAITRAIDKAVILL